MNLAAIAYLIFEQTKGYVVFEDAEDREIDNPDFDEDQLLLDMPDAQLDLVFKDECWAVASDEISLEKANLIAYKGDKSFGVFILEEAVNPDDVPECFAQSIPVGLGWKYEPVEGAQMSFIDELIEARVSGVEEPANVSEDVLHEVSVSDPDVVAEPEGTTASDEIADTVHSVSVSDPDVVEELEGTTASEEDSEPELTEIVKMNDAELLGKDHPDMQALLNKPAVFMAGDLYGAKDRRNTQDGDWQRVELPWLAWLNGADNGKRTWGLTRHPVHKSKEGSSIVLADSIDGARKDGAIKTMYAVGLDIDSGAKLDDVIAKLEEKGLFAVVYTSHSHGKDTLVLKHDDIMRKLKLDESPNRTQIQIYLREHHKDRFDDEFIQTIEIGELRKQTPDGLRTILKTEPLDKFRVILPLWEPIELADLGASVNAWKEAWADVVIGVGVNILGVNIDATCSDVNRLFYTPRHPAGSDWYAAVVQGRPLRFEEIEPYSKIRYVKERDPGDPFASMGSDLDTGKTELFITDNNFNLNEWHRNHKDRFLISDVIDSYCGDKIRVAGGEKAGTVHLECPYEHEHSSEGGTATMAMNPDENEAGYWTIFCRHDACNGRHKLEFLKAMLDEGWLPESVLTDGAWNIPLPDEEVVEETSEERELTPCELAAQFNTESRDEDIMKFMKRQLKLGNVDKNAQASITAEIASNTALTKRDVTRLWQDVRREMEDSLRQRAEADGEQVETVPVVNQWDFGDMVKWGNKRIQDANAKSPRLFHYIDEIARIDENADRIPRVRMLIEKQFSAELNEITKWHHLSTVGDSERLKEVAAPSEVVSQLYNSAHTIYPRLRGLVTTPTFTRGGALISTPGFHESGLYYWNTGDFDIPAVSREPTAEEITEAKRLLVEEVFADFPLGGLSRDLIVAKVLNPDDPEGVPAVTNLIAMLLLMFCRDLIDGPTPGHLLTKPSPGTGASLLTDVCSMIAHGEPTPAQPIPPNNEEMQKTLLTLIADGTNIVYFDNIDQSVDSGSLASALTAPKVRGRILGKTQMAEAEVRTVWILCGNNVRMSQELIRRLVMVDLDANTSDPQHRSGWRHEDIQTYVKENRGDLVWACLTLIQNWVAKGMKGDKGIILNSFENWSRIMGGILRDAGLKGFLRNRDALKERANDGGEDDISIFLDAWWERYLSNPILMRSPEPKDDDLIKMAIEQDLQLPLRMKKTPDDDLTYDPRQFGAFLGTYEGRVIKLTDTTEVKVTRGRRAKYGYYWQLEVVKAAEIEEES